MARGACWVTAVCFAALLPPAAGADPRLESLTPPMARPGERVAIAGSGFGAEPVVVRVSGVRTAVDRWSDKRILFHVAEHNVSGPVRVRTADGLVSESPSLIVDHDLQENRFTPVAAVTGGSYMAVDVRSDPRGQYEGVLVALAEHAPRIGSDQLRVVFHAFSDEELAPLGAYSRAVGPDERYHAVALDPLNRKAYVSGWERLLGANRYLLELDTSDLARPTLNHREDTGNTLISDMDAIRDVLWAGVVDKGAELFRAYALRPGKAPLQPIRSIRSGVGLARVGRVKVLDENVTVGCAWFGSRPDLFLFSTFGTETVPAPHTAP